MSLEQKAPRSSLLAQHLKILGHEPGAWDQATAAENTRIAGYELPTLQLPTDIATRRSLSRWSQWVPLAAAALVLLFVARFKSDTDSDGGVRSKGISKVWVYWERDGVVGAWPPTEPLRSGDRVRTEVLAGEPSVAVAVVVDRQSVMLSDAEQVWQERLMLKVGERASFPGSFKLDVEDEGEQLMIVVCPQNAALELRQALPVEGQALALKGLTGVCKIDTYALR